MTTLLAAASPLPRSLNILPTAAAVAIVCAAVIAEIVAVPAVLLPGGTITLLAGALIGAGRPAFAVAVPVAVAVIAGDQLAYFTGAAVTSWWRHRSRRDSRPRGPSSAWFAAAMPSLAGAAGLGYRAFAVRAVILRLPWLAAALGAGALAADSITRIGHVAGIAGFAASGLVVTGLMIAARRTR